MADNTLAADSSSDGPESALTEEQYARLSTVANQLAVELLLKDSDSDGRLSDKELTQAFLELLAAALGSSTTEITNAVLQKLSTAVDTDVPEPESTNNNPTFKEIRQGSTHLDLSLFDSKFSANDKKFKNIQTMFDSLSSIYSQIGHKHIASAIVSGVLDVDRIPELPATKITSETLSRPIGVKYDDIDLDNDINHNKGTYFGFDEDNVEYDGLSYRDADNAIMSSWRFKAAKTGSIEVSLTNNNPQPGGAALSSEATLYTDKQGLAKFIWRNFILSQDSSQESLEWNNFKLVAKDSKITQHSISPDFIGIQTGIHEFQLNSSNSSDETTISFSNSVTRYTKSPVVIVSPAGSEDFGKVTCSVIDTNTNQFRVRVYHDNYDSNRKISLHWAAYPVSGDTLTFV